MESKSFTVEAIEFTGQDMDGWNADHLGVAPDGRSITQLRQNFPGGSAIAYQGDWIATFPSGQVVVLSRATWNGEKAEAYTVVNGQRIAVTEPRNAVRETKVEVVPVNPIGAAGWPAKVVEHEIVVQQQLDNAGNPYPDRKVARPIGSNPAEVEGATRIDPVTGRQQTSARDPLGNPYVPGETPAADGPPAEGHTRTDPATGRAQTYRDLTGWTDDAKPPTP